MMDEPTFAVSHMFRAENSPKYNLNYKKERKDERLQNKTGKEHHIKSVVFTPIKKNKKIQS